MDDLRPIPAAQLENLVIFDGVCNLCEASVVFIIDHDPAGMFRFVPSQSELGAALERQMGVNRGSLDTVVLLRGGRAYGESAAAVGIAEQFGGAWRALGWLRWVPRPLRDWGYRLIARHRYAWFGRKQVCMVPTPELRGRFLETTADLDRRPAALYDSVEQYGKM